MCHETSKIDAVLAEMESAAEHLSNTQQRINTPMFDLLFKLINMPQSSGLAGAKLKTLHTYAHRFIEFYMTECPDGVSIHTINTNAIHTISNKLRAQGDGLARLLAYLGMESENECLTECVDTLAVAYDTFAIVMAKVEAAYNEFDDYDCDCDCDCGCCDGDCECDDNCDCDCHDDSKMQYEEAKAAAKNLNDEAKAAAKEREEAERFFKMLFGMDPAAAEAATKAKQTQSEPDEDEDEDEFAEELAGMLTGLFGALMGANQPKAAPSKDEASAVAERLAKMLGIDNIQVDVKRPAPAKEPEAKKPAVDPADRAAEILSRVLGIPKEHIHCTPVKPGEKPTGRRMVVREVRPGYWQFGM